MEAIEGDLGVSSKCPQGLSTEEIIEILKIAGYSS
jgi:hypothetical protein